MQQIYFEALLKTDQGELLEIGRACLSEVPDCVDFKNEFVPLLKLGTHVQITAIFDNEEAFTFDGNVYFSSRKILRITSVHSDCWQMATYFFAMNASINASLFFYTPSIFYSAKKAEKIDCTIYYMDQELLKFSTIESVEVGQQLMLSLEEPVSLKKVILRVKSKKTVGRLAAIHVCEILSVPSSSAANLAGFVQQLALQEAKRRQELAQNPEE